MKKVLVPPCSVTIGTKIGPSTYNDCDLLGVQWNRRDGLCLCAPQMLCLREETSQVVLDSLKFDVEVGRNLFVAPALPA